MSEIVQCFEHSLVLPFLETVIKIDFSSPVATEERYCITTWWTCVWASFGIFWWIGKPGMLQSVGSQRIRCMRNGSKLNWMVMSYLHDRILGQCETFMPLAEVQSCPLLRLRDQGKMVLLKTSHCSSQKSWHECLCFLGSHPWLWMAERNSVCLHLRDGSESLLGVQCLIFPWQSSMRCAPWDSHRPWIQTGVWMSLRQTLAVFVFHELHRQAKQQGSWADLAQPDEGHRKKAFAFSKLVRPGLESSPLGAFGRGMLLSAQWNHQLWAKGRQAPHGVIHLGVLCMCR